MISNIVITIFGFKIYWYGLFYIFGFLFGYIFIIKYGPKYLNLKKEILEEIFLITMIMGVLGGRIFQIIFYKPIFYFQNPSQIIAVWNGGMSIHGGFFFAGLSLIYFAKKYKINIYKLTDLFVIPSALGLAFGRLANFINQELVGKITKASNPFSVIFSNYDNKPRWPSTIFEGFKNLITFEIILFLFFFKNLKSGIITSWFLILYNFGRFFIDFLRQPTVTIGILSMGQILSLIFGVLGILILFDIKRKKNFLKN